MSQVKQDAHMLKSRERFDRNRTFEFFLNDEHVMELRSLLKRFSKIRRAFLSTKNSLIYEPMGNVCAQRRRSGAKGMRMLAGANGFVKGFGFGLFLSSILNE